MTAILIDWAILTFAMWATARLLRGMELKGSLLSHLFVSAVFGLLAAVLGTFLYGLFGAMTLGIGFLWIVSWLTRTAALTVVLKVTDMFFSHLEVRGWGTAFVAAALISLIGTATEYALNTLL